MAADARQILANMGTSIDANVLFNTFATGFRPDAAALDFWNTKIANEGPEAALTSFLNPSDPNAPRAAAMTSDPDYLRALGQEPAEIDPRARAMFDVYASGFAPNDTALQFWSQKINDLGYQGALNQFLNPTDTSSPRYQAMQADPQYQATTGTAEDFQRASGMVGEENRMALDAELRNWYNTYTGGRGMATPVDAYVSMLNGRDGTYLTQDYNAAKQKMLDDAVRAGLYGGPGISYSTGAYDSWVRQQAANNASTGPGAVGGGTGGTGGTTTRPVTVMPGAGVEEGIQAGTIPQRVIIGGAPLTIGGGFAAYPYNTQALADQLYAPVQQMLDIVAAGQMPPGLVAPPNMAGIRQTAGFQPFTTSPVVPLTAALPGGVPTYTAGGVNVVVPTVTPTAPTTPTPTPVTPRPVTPTPVTPTPVTPTPVTPVVTTPTTVTAPVVNVTPTTPTRIVTNPTPTPEPPATGADSATIRGGSVTPATTFVSPFFSNPVTSTGGGIYTTEQAVSDSGQGISSTLTDIGQALSSYGEMPYLPGGLGLGILGNLITGQQADAMGNAADKLRNIAANPLPGVTTISDRNGNIFTVSNPTSIAASDVNDFGTEILQTTNAPDGAGIDDERTADMRAGLGPSTLSGRYFSGTGSIPLPGEELYGDVAGFAQGGIAQLSPMYRRRY